MKKKILIFTGSRADYGLLKPLIRNIKIDKYFLLTLVAGSHHFSKKYGFTFKEILNDKFKINYSLSTKLNETSFEGIIKYCGKSMMQYSNFLKKNKPDMVILLGDRYEVFSFCIATFFLKIPIAHIHGGELTTAAIDDSLRHSITKLSDYHFVSHDNYKKRVLQLGENPKNVFNVGALGVENIFKNKTISKKKLFKKYKVPENMKKAVITFHPETLSKIPIKNQINNLLLSLKKINNLFYIFTYNNNDPFGNYFVKKINQFNNNFKNSIIIKSMGSNIYHSFIKNCDLVIGNSSSGIIEAPSLKVQTLNIGERQMGRICSRSVTHCKNERKEIVKSIKSILKNNKKINYFNPYYKKNTSKKIIFQIKKKLNKEYQTKIFHDVI